MSKKYDVPIQVRIDKSTDAKLIKMAKDANVTKSEIIRVLLGQTELIQVRDGKKIATELFKIRKLLEVNEYNIAIVKKIEETCDLVIEKIYELFAEDGEKSGNSESN